MEIFRNYQINSLNELGQGAFGYVEKVELYNSNNKLCGLYGRKILRPSKEILTGISFEEIKRRFLREVVYQSHCSHSNVTQIFIFNKHVENPYFVMELADCSLDKEISSNLLDENEKINIFIMILKGVKVVHDRGYLHRDIKPQNILKFPNGVYKISDFGLIKNASLEGGSTILTAIGQAMGTKRYMAPEILYNAEYSKQTDIYAIGKVMEDLSIDNEDYKKIIEKCHSMYKDRRYGNVEEIIDDVIGVRSSMKFNGGE